MVTTFFFIGKTSLSLKFSEMEVWDCALGEVSFCLKTKMKTTKKPQMHNNQSKERKATGLPLLNQRTLEKI